MCNLAHSMETRLPAEHSTHQIFGSPLSIAPLWACFDSVHCRTKDQLKQENLSVLYATFALEGGSPSCVCDLCRTHLLTLSESSEIRQNANHTGDGTIQPD